MGAVAGHQPASQTWTDWSTQNAQLHSTHWTNSYVDVKCKLSGSSATMIIRPPTAVPANRQHSVRRLCVQLNCTLYLEQFTNYHLNSIHYQHFSMTPQHSSFLRQHRHRLNCYHPRLRFELLFDIWRVTNADYLLTYLLTCQHSTIICRSKCHGSMVAQRSHTSCFTQHQSFYPILANMRQFMHNPYHSNANCNFRVPHLWAKKIQKLFKDFQIPFLDAFP